MAFGKGRNRGGPGDPPLVFCALFGRQRGRVAQHLDGELGRKCPEIDHVDAGMGVQDLVQRLVGNLRSLGPDIGMFAVLVPAMAAPGRLPLGGLDGCAASGSSRSSACHQVVDPATGRLSSGGDGKTDCVCPAFPAKVTRRPLRALRSAWPTRFTAPHEGPERVPGRWTGQADWPEGRNLPRFHWSGARVGRHRVPGKEPR